MRAETYDNIEVFKDTMKMCKENAELKSHIDVSKEIQKVYHENDMLMRYMASACKPVNITITANRTFQAAQKYDTGRTAVLNFADFYKPGGLVEVGSKAQEESLCRISTLYPCITDDRMIKEFYKPHKEGKNRLKQMVEANGDYLMLHYIQEADKNPLYQSVSVEEIKKIGSTFEHQLANAFRLSVPTIRKTYRYVSENNIHASDYFDYLENAEFLHYNLNADSVRYPKKFKEEHDFAAKEVKSKLDEKAYYRIQLLLPAMHERYDFEDDDFIVTAPKDGKAIKDEGTKLGHCVATYIPRVAKGETVILFIRRKSEPNKPFVTMEVKNDTVIQVRARENGTPEKAVQEFVKKFKKAKQVA